MIKKILLLFSVTVLVCANANAGGFWAVVDRIVDGDTIKVIDLNNEPFKVRWTNIDTPETHYNGHAQEPWGTMASNRLKEKLPVGEMVYIDYGDSPEFTYGRVLGLVFYQGRNLNLEMVREGLAATYIVYPGMEQMREFSDAMEQAMQEQIGIFNPENPLPKLPYEWRLQVSGRQPYWWVGNIDTKKFLPPEGLYTYPASKRIFFKSMETAAAAGFQPDER